MTSDLNVLRMCKNKSRLINTFYVIFSITSFRRQPRTNVDFFIFIDSSISRNCDEEFTTIIYVCTFWAVGDQDSGHEITKN